MRSRKCQNLPADIQSKSQPILGSTEWHVQDAMTTSRTMHTCTIRSERYCIPTTAVCSAASHSDCHRSCAKCVILVASCVCRQTHFNLLQFRSNKADSYSSDCGLQSFLLVRWHQGSSRQEHSSDHSRKAPVWQRGVVGLRYRIQRGQHSTSDLSCLLTNRKGWSDSCQMFWWDRSTPRPEKLCTVVHQRYLAP